MRTDKLQELALELVQLKEKCIREGLLKTGHALEPAVQQIGWEIAAHTEIAAIEHQLAYNAYEKINQSDTWLSLFVGEGDIHTDPNCTQLKVWKRNHDHLDYLFKFRINDDKLQLKSLYYKNKHTTQHLHTTELYLADPQIEQQILNFITETQTTNLRK